MKKKKETGRRNEADGAVLERAFSAVCGWLAENGFLLEEALEEKDGRTLCVRMALSPAVDSSSSFDDDGWDLPEYEWDEGAPEGEALLELVSGLFRKGDSCCPDEVVRSAGWREVQPGRAVRTVRRRRVPKFSFSSLEEFVIKAEASGEFPGEARE